MAESPVLESVAADVRRISAEIEEAEDLLSALQDAGEDTTRQRADLQALRIRKEKWARMLNSRGYSTT